MQQTCQICLQNTPAVYSITNCSHKYCLDCCQRHIQACIVGFTDIKCLAEGCRSLFDDKCIPYEKLDDEYKSKLKKFRRHHYFINNPTIKNCKAENCDGQFMLNKKPYLCTICKRQHCQKCLELLHQGNCSQQVAEMMQKLNYKQCKKCHIYVEKIQGCNYVSCTCGNQFCYACGNQWVHDPCRLKVFHQINEKISGVLRVIKFRQNDANSNAFKNVLRPVFQVFGAFFWIFVGVLLLPLLGAIGFLVLFILLSPIIVIALLISSTIQRRWLSNLLLVLTILLYPLVSALLFLLLIFLVFVFLFARDRFQYHHGMFDPMIQSFLNYVFWFLDVFRSIVA